MKTRMKMAEKAAFTCLRGTLNRRKQIVGTLKLGNDNNNHNNNNNNNNNNYNNNNNHNSKGEKILLTTMLTIKILFTINSLEKRKNYSFKTLLTIPVDLKIDQHNYFMFFFSLTFVKSRTF